MRHLPVIILLGCVLACSAPAFAECVSGDCVNGQGAYTSPIGNKYVGQFKDGKAHGQGTYTSPSGTKYVGHWRDGKMDGQGTMTWPDGTKYVGQWKDNRMNGQGTMTSPDGGKYVGQFKDDKRNALYAHPVLAGPMNEALEAYSRKDYSTALTLFTPLAEAGEAEAQTILGALYENGLGISKNYSEAIKWYKRAAEQGYGQAKIQLGHMYSKGVGVKQDYAEAMRLYRSCADIGNAKCQLLMGNMYENSLGVAKNAAEAKKWYRLAAEQGLAMAQTSLGGMYSKDKMLSEDNAEAVKWYRKAADQGEPFAQYNLGVKYAKGQGVKKDLVLAHMWFNISAATGDADAKASRDYIQEKMTKDEITKALEMARELFPQIYGYTHQATGIRFPAKLKNIELVHVEDYEQKSPGLGVGISYRNDFMRVDYYIYNSGMTSILDGVESQIVQEAFQNIKDEIAASKDKANYSNIKYSTLVETLTFGDVRFLHSKFEMSDKGVGSVSHTYLSAHKNFFIKVRVTYFENKSMDAEAGLTPIIQMVAKQIRRQ